MWEYLGVFSGHTWRQRTPCWSAALCTDAQAVWSSWAHSPFGCWTIITKTTGHQLFFPASSHHLEQSTGWNLCPTRHKLHSTREAEPQVKMSSTCRIENPAWIQPSRTGVPICPWWLSRGRWYRSSLVCTIRPGIGFSPRNKNVQLCGQRRTNTPTGTCAH